jgi:hypothetical protein
MITVLATSRAASETQEPTKTREGGGYAYAIQYICLGY